MDELETLQNGVTAARNTITKQMQTDNEAAAQANQTLLQEMEKTQQEIETAKKIIQGELRRQGENSYETIEEGFAGTEKRWTIISGSLVKSWKNKMKNRAM